MRGLGIQKLPFYLIHQLYTTIDKSSSAGIYDLLASNGTGAARKPVLFYCSARDSRCILQNIAGRLRQKYPFELLGFGTLHEFMEKWKINTPFKLRMDRPNV